MEDIVRRMRELMETDGPAIKKGLHQSLLLIRNTWRDENPGRDRPQTFFVRSFEIDPMPYRKPPFRRIRYERFWIKELTSEPVAAERTLGPKGLLGSTRDLWKAVCPKCEFGRAMVVGTYERTEHGPFGEVWTHQIHTLCTSCGAVTAMTGYKQEDILF